MLSATILITFQRSFRRESGSGGGFLAVVLSPLSVQAKAIKPRNQMREYFFIAIGKIKKSNLEKPKLDFYKKKIFFYWLIKSKSSIPISSDTEPLGPPFFT